VMFINSRAATRCCLGIQVVQARVVHDFKLCSQVLFRDSYGAAKRCSGIQVMLPRFV
jgi:hypothetical protein